MCVENALVRNIILIRSSYPPLLADRSISLGGGAEVLSSFNPFVLSHRQGCRVSFHIELLDPLLLLQVAEALRPGL